MDSDLNTLDPLSIKNLSIGILLLKIVEYLFRKKVVNKKRRKIYKTRKQRSNNFTKNIIVFLMNNFISTNRKGETKLSSLPIGHQENKKKLVKLLFSCFVLLPGKLKNFLKIDIVQTLTFKNQKLNIRMNNITSSPFALICPVCFFTIPLEWGFNLLNISS